MDGISESFADRATGCTGMLARFDTVGHAALCFPPSSADLLLFCERYNATCISTSRVAVPRHSEGFGNIHRQGVERQDVAKSAVWPGMATQRGPAGGECLQSGDSHTEAGKSVLVLLRFSKVRNPRYVLFAGRSPAPTLRLQIIA